MLVTEGRPADYWGVFLQDLQEYISSMQVKGHSIILGLDANDAKRTQELRILQNKVKGCPFSSVLI